MPVQPRAGFESTEMAPNVASNGDFSNGNGVHMNGNAAANGNGSAARPAVAPKSNHEDRWSGIERPYSQVCISASEEKILTAPPAAMLPQSSVPTWGPSWDIWPLVAPP